MMRSKTQSVDTKLASARIACFLLAMLMLIPVVTTAQILTSEPEFENELPSPKGAFLRSLVLPGWGHHYVDANNWNRGKIHLAADITMMLSYFGLSTRVNTLEGNLITQASSKAGISLKGKSRDIELAVANFNSIDEYNDYQLRVRNWDKVITPNAQNSWNWENSEDRFAFQDTRDKISKADNQLPTLLTLMVANRVLSGINAFTRARNMQVTPQASLSYLNEFGEPGITARVVVGF